MKQLSNIDINNQQNVFPLIEEQQALQNIYVELRKLDKQNIITKFFTKIKEQFAKDSISR